MGKSSVLRPGGAEGGSALNEQVGGAFLHGKIRPIFRRLFPGFSGFPRANWRLRKGAERANSCGVARLMLGQSRSLLALEPVQYSLAAFFGRGLRPISGKTHRYFHALPPQGSSLPLRPTSVPATRSWLSCSVLVLASPLFLARSSSRFRDGRAEPTPAPRPFRQTLLGAFGETRSCRPVIADAHAGDPRVLMVGAAESAPRSVWRNPIVSTGHCRRTRGRPARADGRRRRVGA